MDFQVPSGTPWPPTTLGTPSHTDKAILYTTNKAQVITEGGNTVIEFIIVGIDEPDTDSFGVTVTYGKGDREKTTRNAGVTYHR